jgi:hypothetical protein
MIATITGIVIFGTVQAATALASSTFASSTFAAIGLAAPAAQAARIILGIAACTGLGFLAWRNRRALRRARFGEAPRLAVVHRVGLSQRSGLTLVEVDGRPYLIVHGDGFARVHATRGPRVARRLATETPS